MHKCPICYKDVSWNICWGCKIDPIRMFIIKYRTYNSIMDHLFESVNDHRRREQARSQIALRNIKRWAKQNKDNIDGVSHLYKVETSKPETKGNL